jgi:adenylate cyclase
MATHAAAAWHHPAIVTQDVTVAFVDIVGFTRLCEEAAVDRIDELVTWLEDAALRATQLRPEVAFVKLVGDATMLAGADPAAVLACVLEMLRSADADPDAPPLHAGIASGRALHREGDWLGRPVNLANHLAAHARAGTVETTLEVVRATGGVRVWTPLGPVRLAGGGRAPAVYRIAA